MKKIFSFYFIIKKKYCQCSTHSFQMQIRWEYVSGKLGKTWEMDNFRHIIVFLSCRLLCLCWWIFYGSDTTFTIHLFGSRWMLCFITTRKAYYNQKKTFYDSNGLRPNIRRNFGTTILIEVKRKKTAYISTGWSGFWIKVFQNKILLFSRVLNFSEENFNTRFTRVEKSFRKVSNSLKK